MSRLRYNGCSGTLGAAHDASTTTLTLTSKLTHEGGDVPTIASPDYLSLSILDADGKCVEIVHVTAYTTAATTATVTRAAEGSTANSHSSGASFVNGPTVADARQIYVAATEPSDWEDGNFWTEVATVAADDFPGVVDALGAAAFYRGHGDGTDEQGGSAATLNTIGTGGPSLVPADSGASSLIVDAEADYIQSATWTTSITHHSMMFAYRGTGTGSTRVLARAGGNKSSIFLRNETVLTISDQVNTTVNLFDDDEHLVILTQDSTAVRVYVDGALAGTWSSAATTSTSYYWRWGDNTGFDGWAGGNYAEMAVWHNKALTTGEIRALHSRWLASGSGGSTVVTANLYQRLFGEPIQLT